MAGDALGLSPTAGAVHVGAGKMAGDALRLSPMVSAVCVGSGKCPEMLWGGLPRWALLMY